ncbi:sensor histidine kinase [Persicimonas caeni]|nr:PAS domain-containing sensor histidine kinase [Persicimonas caeni]
MSPKWTDYIASKIRAVVGRPVESPRGSEAPLRAAFEQAPFAFQTYSPDGAAKTANQRWHELWDAPPGALDGYNVFEDPQVRALGVVDQIRCAFAGEVVRLSPIYYDPSRIGRQGEPRWIRVSFYPLKDQNGEIFEVVQVTDDITALVQAEAAQRRALELQRLALASAKMGMWDFDVNAQTVAWDARCRELFGATEPVVPLEVPMSRIHENDRPEVNAALEAAVDPTLDNAYDVEFRVIPRPGELRWVHATGKALHESGGADAIGTRLVGVVGDTTEQKQATQRKDEFLAMLGHELRNPLAAIQLAVDLLEQQGEVASIRERTVAMLGRQSAQMAKLIDGLLDVSRIVRGKIMVDKQEVDLTQLLHDVIAVREGNAKAKNIHLEVELASDEPMALCADPARLTQIFENLVSNALKFTDPGGTVKVVAERSNGCAVVRVSDTGIGFRPERADVLFEAFKQEPQDIARQRGGLGLGLAVAAGLVELHGGTIEAHSSGLGEGATFTVRLPL